MKILILDQGYIELLGTFGDELTIVNAARVSFGVEKDQLSDKDLKLIKYLYQNKHMSPFRHLIFRFKIKAPEFTMRQMLKHCVGIEATSNSSTKDHAWNEISGRYKKVDDFYIPKVWRMQSKNSKQASDGQLSPEKQEKVKLLFDKFMTSTTQLYDNLLELGVAREQARILLPLNQYTEVIWTCSAQALLNFIELRDADHAQWEIRQYAKVFRNIIHHKFPHLYNIWFNQ